MSVIARLPRRAHLGGAVKVCNKNEKVTKTLLIYGDGSFKAPAHNPNGRERGGWGVAKFEVVQKESAMVLAPACNLGGRTVTPASLNCMKPHDLGAAEETNDTGEWSALGHAIRDVLRDLKNDPELVLEIEFRQDCMDIIKKLLNGEVVLQNAMLVRQVKKLWRELLNHKRVPSVFLGHAHAHGRCTVPDRGDDVADRVAKFGADGKFSAHGEFEDIERLHNDYKAKFDLASPDEILIGVHSGAEGSDDEANPGVCRWSLRH
jgi:hypothetical protein